MGLALREKLTLLGKLVSTCGYVHVDGAHLLHVCVTVQYMVLYGQLRVRLFLVVILHNPLLQHVYIVVIFVCVFVCTYVGIPGGG